MKKRQLRTKKILPKGLSKYTLGRNHICVDRVRSKVVNTMINSQHIIVDNIIDEVIQHVGYYVVISRMLEGADREFHKERDFLETADEVSYSFEIPNMNSYNITMMFKNRLKLGSFGDFNWSDPNDRAIRNLSEVESGPNWDSDDA